MKTKFSLAQALAFILIKTNSEKILPFLEKTMLGESFVIEIKDQTMTLILSDIEKKQIMTSYLANFNELIESINPSILPQKGELNYSQLNLVLKDYEIKKLFNKMNKNIKNKPETKKINKI